MCKKKQTKEAHRRVSKRIGRAGIDYGGERVKMKKKKGIQLSKIRLSKGLRKSSELRGEKGWRGERGNSGDPETSFLSPRMQTKRSKSCIGGEAGKIGKREVRDPVCFRRVKGTERRVGLS